MKNLKKDDVVRCIDGSWSYEFKDGELISTGNICDNKVYKIIATDLKLPTDEEVTKCRNRFNDTIIKEIKTDEIIFTQRDYLRLKHRCDTCPKCGQRYLNHL